MTDSSGRIASDASLAPASKSGSLTAYSCANEAAGGPVCERWCGVTGKCVSAFVPTQAEREAFEEWAGANQFTTYRDDTPKYQDYHRVSTRWAWMGFQAGVAYARKEPK
jgi:hypothetical protein